MDFSTQWLLQLSQRPTMLLFPLLMVGCVFFASPGLNQPSRTGRIRIGRSRLLFHPFTDENISVATDPSAPERLAPEPLGPLLVKHRLLQERMRWGKIPMRAIVARCYGQDECGGIGDRLFGIVTLFLEALLSDRAFFVEHKKPVDQTDFFTPNSVDWRVDGVEHVEAFATLDDARRKGPFHKFLMPGAQCVHVMEFMKAQVKTPILYMNSNHRTECVLKRLLRGNVLPDDDTPWFDKRKEDSLRLWASNVTHFILNYLFKFSPLVQKQATTILEGTDLPADFDSKVTRECLVCVHVRSGKNTHEDGGHHNIADFGKCAHMVEEGINKAKTCPRKVHWLVISDHPDAPSIVGGNFTKPLSSSKTGPIVHIDHIGVGEQHRSGALRLYVDWFVLTRCKHFVASLSTLGETASMYHGASVRRFDMERAGQCSPTPLGIQNWQRDRNIPKEAWLKALEH